MSCKLGVLYRAVNYAAITLVTYFAKEQCHMIVLYACIGIVYCF